MQKNDVNRSGVKRALKMMSEWPQDVSQGTNMYRTLLNNIVNNIDKHRSRECTKIHTNTAGQRKHPVHKRVSEVTPTIYNHVCVSAA